MPTPDRLRQILRREPVNGRAWRELARLHADDLPVSRNRGFVGRLRAQHLRAPGRKPRFRLRDVRACHLTHIEAIAGLAQLLLQNLDVAPLQIERRGVAQQIHVGRHGVEQHRLLGDAQRFARRLNLALGLARAVRRLKTVVESLCCGDAVTVRCHVARQLRVVRRESRRPRRRVPILLADGGVDAHFRAVSRQRLRHAFICRPHQGAL